MNFNDKVVYQVYPKSFYDTNGDGIGDLKGVISKLDYIAGLGVDYIWLSPICKSPQFDNGYDIADYYHVDPMFGDDDDYFELIKEAKKRNIKIMMDLVLNHVSSEHVWFQKALKLDPKYYDYFIWTDTPNDLIGFFSEPAWTFVPEVGKYYFHLFDKHQPDLNWDNPNVRQDIYAMVNYWIDMGVEGFRLDVIDLIGKEPFNKITGHGPNFIKYLNELNNHTFKDKILTVGECWNSTTDQAYKMCNKDGLTQVFHFTHLIQTNGVDKWDQKPVDFNDIISIIKRWQNEFTGSQTQVMNNHDMPRLVSLWLDDDEFRYESATLLAGLFTLLNGTTYIYQGEEIGMVNANLMDINDYNDVETHNKYQEYVKEGILSEDEIMQRIALISRDNARTPMQWNSNKHAGFTSGIPWLNVNRRYEEINVETDLSNAKSIYKLYQLLIKFKKDNYDLISQKILDISFVDDLIVYNKPGFKFIGNMSCNTHDYNYDHFDLSNYENVELGILLPFQFVIIRKDSN